MTEAGGGTREAGDGEGTEGVWEREAGRERGESERLSLSMEFVEPLERLRFRARKIM